MSRRSRQQAARFADGFIFAVQGGSRAPRDARRQLEELLPYTVGGTALETVRLLLSELVTNSVEHGGASERDSIEVAGTVMPATIRVEVASSEPRFSHTPTMPPIDEPRGRGLLLVQSLSEEWGITASAGVTSVWFEVALG